MFTLDGQINGASTLEVFEDGGYELIIPGTFESGANYNVHVGDYRNSNDPICYSGIPDQRNIIYPELNGTLYSYTPLLIVSGPNPFSVTVINTSTLASQTLTDVLYVRARQFYNKVYQCRKTLPPRYKTMARMIEEEIA